MIKMTTTKTFPSQFMMYFLLAANNGGR